MSEMDGIVITGMEQSGQQALIKLLTVISLYDKLSHLLA